MLFSSGIEINSVPKVGVAAPVSSTQVSLLGNSLQSVANDTACLNNLSSAKPAIQLDSKKFRDDLCVAFCEDNPTKVKELIQLILSDDSSTYREKFEFFQRLHMNDGCSRHALYLAFDSSDSPGSRCALNLGGGSAKSATDSILAFVKTILDSKELFTSDKVELLLDNNKFKGPLLHSVFAFHRGGLPCDPKGFEVFAKAILDSDLPEHYKVELLLARDQNGKPALHNTAEPSGELPEFVKAFVNTVLTSNLALSDKLELLQARIKREKISYNESRDPLYEQLRNRCQRSFEYGDSFLEKAFDRQSREHKSNVERFIEAIKSSCLSHQAQYVLIAHLDRSALKDVLNHTDQASRINALQNSVRAITCLDEQTKNLALDERYLPSLEYALTQAIAPKVTDVFIQAILESDLPAKEKIALLFSSKKSAGGYANNANLVRTILTMKMEERKQIELLDVQNEAGVNVFAQALNKAHSGNFFSALLEAMINSKLSEDDKQKYLKTYLQLMDRTAENYQEKNTAFRQAVLSSDLDELTKSVLIQDSNIKLIQNAKAPSGFRADNFNYFHTVDEIQGWLEREVRGGSPLIQSDDITMIKILIDAGNRIFPGRNIYYCRNKEDISNFVAEFKKSNMTDAHIVASSGGHRYLLDLHRHPDNRVTALAIDPVGVGPHYEAWNSYRGYASLFDKSTFISTRVLSAHQGCTIFSAYFALCAYRNQKDFTFLHEQLIKGIEPQRKDLPLVMFKHIQSTAEIKQLKKEGLQGIEKYEVRRLQFEKVDSGNSIAYQRRDYMQMALQYLQMLRKNGVDAS